ncbi:MAG: hypothetical protein P0121_12290 [Nitrospira sp.]|nr:hypothetical protein [Nitrospira sp.]
MPYVIFGLSLILYGLSPNPSALADEILRITKILDRPSDYQAKVVIVEGRASDVMELPPRFRVHRCAGGPVYDAQLFQLHDQSGSIQVGVAGTCKPGAMQPVSQDERLRIRGVVVTDEKDPLGIPVIYADAIDRVTP